MILHAVNRLVLKAKGILSSLFKGHWLERRARPLILTSSVHTPNLCIIGNNRGEMVRLTSEALTKVSLH